MYVKLPSPSGDGGLYSDVDDLYRWVTVLSDGKFLSSASRDEMMTPALGDYGTGWFTRKRYGRQLISHTGSLPGFVSVIDRFAGSELTVIVLSNIDVGRISRVTNDIEAMAFHLPYDLPRSHHIVTIEPAAVAPLIGRYKSDDGSVITIAQGKRFLEASIPDQYTAGLLPESTRQFYMPLAEGTLRFAEETEGKARTLTMHYNGKDIIARRIQ
jgi:CubicO group peptidase (beta-lactamase class C family)